MTVLVAVILVVAVAAIIGGRWARSRRRDEKSIESHRSALGVIEHVAGADESTIRAHDRATVHVRIVDGPANGVPRPAQDDEVVPVSRPERRSDRPSFPLQRDRALRPPETVWAGSDAAPPPSAADRPVVDHEVAKLIASRARAARAARVAAASAVAGASEFEGVFPAGAAPEPPTPWAPAVPAGAGSPPRRRRRMKVRPTTHHRTPVALAAAVVALVLAAVTGVGLRSLGGSTSHHHPPARVASGASTGQAGAHPTPPPHPAPPAPTVVATSASAGYATYTVNATTLEVSLTTTNPCWLELHNGTSSGPLVYEGTLPAGASQSFHVAAPIWLRLGDPAGTKLVIDGAPLALPTTGDPFDVAVTVPAGA